MKKKYNLQAAQDDLKKRQDLYNAAQKKIDNLFKSINDNFTCMSITLPEDKKKTVDKEIKAVQEKLEVAGRFGSAVKQIEDFVNNLNAFDVALKSLNDWMVQATGELTAIRDAAGSMLPEDRVARTMDLQEDIASKLQGKILISDMVVSLFFFQFSRPTQQLRRISFLRVCLTFNKNIVNYVQFRTTFFCSGDKPPQDAQDYKDELNRITKYITDLDAQTRKECDAYSEVFQSMDILSYTFTQLTKNIQGREILGRVQDRHQGVQPLAGRVREVCYWRPLQALRPCRGQGSQRQGHHLRQDLPQLHQGP